jgi:hypothetical protein
MRDQKGRGLVTHVNHVGSVKPSVMVSDLHVDDVYILALLVITDMAKAGENESVFISAIS